ncbi:MAG: hypothetical protein ABMA64_29785 [Myxococcota bacterium]
MKTAVSFWVVAACSGGEDEAGPSAETGGEGTPARACEADLRLTYAEGGCFGYPDQWDFKVDTEGCATTATLNSWRTSGAQDWDEQHPFTLQLEGADGAYQNWVAGPLPHASPAADWRSGVNSVFDCTADASTLTYGARLFDGAGALVACTLWGHDPALVQGGGASALNSDPSSDFVSCVVGPF